MGSVEAKFGLVGKPRVSSINFNRLNGPRFHMEYARSSAPGPAFIGYAVIPHMGCGNTAYGDKWVKDTTDHFSFLDSIFTIMISG